MENVINMKLGIKCVGKNHRERTQCKGEKLDLYAPKKVKESSMQLCRFKLISYFNSMNISVHNHGLKIFKFL